MQENECILRLEGVRKSFGGVQALKGVGFELKRGEIHALLGENGAGKSTLIKILTGVHKPDEGNILLKGKPVTIADPIDARKKGIAAIYQELSLIDSLTVAENIFLGNEPTATPIGYCKRRQLYADSDAFLQRFGIQIDSRALVGSLGLGQKRIIEIVKALAINAEILLLDEPTTGMSRAEIDTLFQIMASLKEKNVTMIYISHYLDEVFRCCDRSTVLRDGMNVDSFEMDRVTVAELVRAMIGRSVSSERYRPAGDFSAAPVAMEAKNFRTQAMRRPVSFQAHRASSVQERASWPAACLGPMQVWKESCESKTVRYDSAVLMIRAHMVWPSFRRTGNPRGCSWNKPLRTTLCCRIWNRPKTVSSCWMERKNAPLPSAWAKP